MIRSLAPLATTAISILAGAVAYDAYNEFEICGGVGRFLRSLKIAALISADYAWSLRGLTEDSDNYCEVNIVPKIKLFIKFENTRMM